MGRKLTGQQVSDAVGDLGWRFVLETLQTSVLVGSLVEAVAVSARVVEAAGADADEHLHVDLRGDRVVLGVHGARDAGLGPREIDLARRISTAVAEAGLRTDAVGRGVPGRSVHLLEIAIDAVDIGRVRPFWKAVLDYVDAPGAAGPEDPIVDPLGQGPAVWFQQMDRPRPERNRIHLDVSVPHDEAEKRIAAAVAAGGRVVSADSAPAFWVLADVEGNEACVSTWQGRDD
ncbi:VOC family protein [Streptoalloteichus hindustanus]|nr:VOC family protein [Streptoalloteichus hindustanus]